MNNAIDQANYAVRLAEFQRRLGQAADLVYLPISADLQYLLGVPRSTPNFGGIRHPGMWLEGAWIAPGRKAVLALPRMTAVFGGLPELPQVDLRILGDWDDPAMFVRDLLREFGLPAKPRIGVSDMTPSETLLNLLATVSEAIFVSVTPVLAEQRMIKSEAEIATMRRAGEITEAAFADVLRQLKPGMRELDVVAEVHHQLWRHGSPGSAFAPLLENSGSDHPLVLGQPMDAWQRELHPPVSVLFDFGAIHAGYCYDFGRTVFFGDPPPEAQRVHSLVMQAQTAGIAALRADTATTSDADTAARQVITDSGYGDFFLHRLGHGVGLDVHEAPYLTAGDETPLQEGMLFTVEPSIMIEDSYSARVEDVVLVGPEGGIPLTRGFQDLYVVD